MVFYHSALLDLFTPKENEVLYPEGVITLHSQYKPSAFKTLSFNLKHPKSIFLKKLKPGGGDNLNPAPKLEASPTLLGTKADAHTLPLKSQE